MAPLTTFQYFAVGGFVNAIAVSLFLGFRKKNHSANVYLAILLMVVSFQTVLNAFDTREFFLEFPHLGKISWLSPTLFGPLIYLFALKISSNDKLLRKSDLLHFTFFLIYLIILAPWFLLSGEEKRDYFQNFELASRDDFGFLNQLSIFIIFFYLALTLFYLRKYREKIANTFSETSRIRLNWLRTFVYAVFGILLISGFTFYGRKLNIWILTEFYHYNYAFVVLIIYWIAYKAATQPIIFNKDQIILSEKQLAEEFISDSTVDNSLPFQFNQEKKYQRSGLDKLKIENQFNQLIDYMKIKKPFLNPEINIYQMAEELKISKHHLSQIINVKAGRNFFDFINEYRVEEVKQKLSSTKFKHLTILAIAFDAGFNSKATFNSVFKKITGITPSEYKNSLKNNVQL